MEFRWVAFITLWTMLSGPVLARPVAQRERGATAAPVRKTTALRSISSERNVFLSDRR
jgi:hypothetical protein